jgi:hypothetical protein
VKKKNIHGVEVYLDDDGRWRDFAGNEYGLSDESSSRDEKVRLGVGFLSLPESHPFTPAARFHDFAFSSPAFMRSNPRSDADRMFLRQMLALAGGSKLLKAQAFTLFGIVKAVGWYWWDCPETRWK